MQNIMNCRPNKNNTLKSLFENNAGAITTYNESIFKTLVLVGIITLLIPVIVSLFSESKSRLVHVYLLSILVFLLTFLIFQTDPIRKRPLLGIYSLFVCSFSISTYLSVVSSPGQRATIILGMFCIFPMSIIDKPYKIRLLSTGFYILHTALSIAIKGKSLGIDDAVNCFCFLMLGLIIGEKLIRIRLEAFESGRQLILEKETDDLTGLKNRRKLFELIGEIEDGEATAPSGVIMMDIDDFKGYNDRFGHSAGDRLLGKFGEILLCYEQMFNLQFFRYGGEEFTGFAWGYDISELKSVFETLKVSVNSIPDLHQEVTVSIGIVDCTIKDMKNYEKYIDLADKALYRAKDEGKNKVVCYDESMVMTFIHKMAH